MVTVTYGRFTYPIEIQLRTLLQDVWGELEHALAYKQGNTHPHIKNSFRLLSTDLQNNDKLISHLRDIRDRERGVGLFALEDAGACEAFPYEPVLEPTLFKQAGPLREAYTAYTAHVSIWREKRRNTKGWAEQGELLYNAVDRLIVNYDDRKDINVEYWLAMEGGFIRFAQGDYDGAMRRYEDIAARWPQSYAPHFRKGEILYIKGQTGKALIAFDESEERLTGESDPFNAYRLKMTLANLYWQMGEDYYGVALNKGVEAEGIYKEYGESFPPLVRQTLPNNLCWYHLERYIITRDKYTQSGKVEDREAEVEAYSIAEKRYRDLEALLEGGGEKRANDYDTAAWFCYQSYLRTGEPEWLVKAKKYCKDGWGLKSYTLHAIISSNLYRYHTEEIMSA